MIGNKTIIKITKVSENLPQYISETVESKMEIRKKRNISPEERQPPKFRKTNWVEISDDTNKI